MERGQRAERAGEEYDPLGVTDDSASFVTRGLRALVPPGVATRFLSVSVATDRSTYSVGDPVDITVAVRNRCPLPIAVPIDSHRIWGWTVDGLVGASDESRLVPTGERELTLRGFESWERTITWDGRFKRTGDRTRWEIPTPGEYEIGAYVNTAGTTTADETTVELTSRGTG